MEPNSANRTENDLIQMTSEYVLNWKFEDSSQIESDQYRRQLKLDICQFVDRWKQGNIGNFDNIHTRRSEEIRERKKSTEETEGMIRQLRMNIDEWIGEKIDETDEAGVQKIITRPAPDADEQAAWKTWMIINDK